MPKRKPKRAWPSKARNARFFLYITFSLSLSFFLFYFLEFLSLVYIHTFGKMLKLWKWYQNSLAVHPVKTQVISSAIIWGVGDIAAQTITYSTAKNKHQIQVNNHKEYPIVLSHFCIFLIKKKRKKNDFAIFFTVLANGFLSFCFYFILLPFFLCLYVCLCIYSLFGQLGICRFLAIWINFIFLGFIILICCL